MSEFCAPQVGHRTTGRVYRGPLEWPSFRDERHTEPKRPLASSAPGSRISHSGHFHAGARGFRIRMSSRRRRKRRAYLPHPRIPQPAETIDKDSDRHALQRIQIHRRASRNGIVAGLKDDLAGQATDCRRTRRHHCPSEPRNGSVARQDDNWPPAGLSEFTPPNLTARRYRRHVAAAAWRNSARLPHSSGSSTGCLSYPA